MGHIGSERITVYPETEVVVGVLFGHLTFGLHGIRTPAEVNGITISRCRQV